MATMKLDKVLGIPQGVKVFTTHEEGCDLPTLIAAITAILSYEFPGPWVAAAALALSIQAAYIADLVRDDNCKGLIIRFSFIAGVIWSIERRGFGPAPCNDPCVPSPESEPPDHIDQRYPDMDYDDLLKLNHGRRGVSIP